MFLSKRDPAVSGAERFQPVSIQDTPGRRDPAQYGKCAEGNYQCRTDLYLSERQKSGEYQAVYSNRPLNDLTFSLKADNPVVTWLTRNEDCVVIRDFRSSTAYKSMWESEKHMFSELGIEYCAGLRQMMIWPGSLRFPVTDTEI